MFTPLWQSLAIQFDHQTLSQLKSSGRTLHKIPVYGVHINHVGKEAKYNPSKDFSVVNGTRTGHKG